MIKRLLHLLGFHSWVEFERGKRNYRQCTECGKTQMRLWGLGVMGEWASVE